MNKAITSQVVLKDGTVLNLNQQQEIGLAKTILLTQDINEQKVKLNGVTFKLSDMLDGAQKEKMLAKKRQQALELEKQNPKQEQNWG